MNQLPTADDLRALFEYVPETGDLLWKDSRRGQVEIGSRAGNLHRPTKGYACHVVCISKRKFKAHRVIWCIVTGAWPKDCIDHINGDATDNRLVNLREATSAENRRNTRLRSSNSSGFKGVSWDSKLRKWRAQIKSAKQTRYLGLFNTPEEAHQAYCIASDALFSTFSNHGTR